MTVKNEAPSHTWVNKRSMHHKEVILVFSCINVAYLTEECLCVCHAEAPAPVFSVSLCTSCRKVTAIDYMKVITII